jgi:hypothetical protein
MDGSSEAHHGPGLLFSSLDRRTADPGSRAVRLGPRGFRVGNLKTFFFLRLWFKHINQLTWFEHLVCKQLCKHCLSKHVGKQSVFGDVENINTQKPQRITTSPPDLSPRCSA